METRGQHRWGLYWGKWQPIFMNRKVAYSMVADKALCKSCQHWGRYNSKPGWQGYCIKLTKNTLGLQEACEQWKSSNPSSRL